jgi:hypothetical protein
VNTNLVEAKTLESFRSFVDRQLAAPGGNLMSPEQALAAWREEQATLSAIREGLADVEAGRTMSVEEFEADFRHRHGIASPE